MRRIVITAVLFLSLACMSLPPTPNDFPSPPPMTVIVENPITTPTTTIEPRPAFITAEKMDEARSFQLMLITRMAAGDSTGISEMVKYPLTVNINGVPTTIASAAEFEANYDLIFADKVVEALSNTNDENLVLLPNGIRVANGEVWFNLYCADPACGSTQFFITQINN